MRLALTDLNKNRVFYRNCMWLQLSQTEKKFNEGSTTKLAFICACDVTKIKNMRGIARGYSFRHTFR